MTYLSAYMHVPTDFQMYRQNSEKSLIGGGGQFPPSGYASAPSHTRLVSIILNNS